MRLTIVFVRDVGDMIIMAFVDPSWEKLQMIAHQTRLGPGPPAVVLAVGAVAVVDADDCGSVKNISHSVDRHFSAVTFFAVG